MPALFELRFDSIQIQHVVVHVIPKHKKNDSNIRPTYSENVSELSPDLKRFFEDKIAKTLISNHSYKICFNNDSPTKMKELLEEIIVVNSNCFIPNSKEIGEFLFNQQNGSNNAGILVVFSCLVKQKNACIIMKLENDTGARLILNEVTHTFDIDEIKNIMLTSKTKVFKIALILKRSDFGIDFDGILMDYQVNIKGKKDVATWFMDKFLGCKAYNDPKVMTQKFYHLTRKYILTLDDDIIKAKYIQDLNSYVQSNIQQLSMEEFADNYLSSTEHKDNYFNFMDSNTFPRGVFHKDIINIKEYLKQFVINFVNGISIHGTHGSFYDKVKLEKADDDKVKAEITSKIKSMK